MIYVVLVNSHTACIYVIDAPTKGQICESLRSVYLECTHYYFESVNGTSNHVLV